MVTSERRSRPQAVLFACGMNAVRSPMAAGLLQQLFGKSIYVGSAGVQKGELDPFAAAVMEEIGIDITRHKPASSRARPAAESQMPVEPDASAR